MFIINATKKEVARDYPEIKSWLRKLKTLRLTSSNSELEFYYSYGFFVPKGNNTLEGYEETSKFTSYLLYDERLEFELSKVRVNLTVKSGQFVISDRMPIGIVPEMIIKIVEEITKIKMIIESEYYNYQDVIDSIPELDKDSVDIEIIRNVVQKDLSKDINLDVDSILDKISDDGYEALSDEEIDFLNKKSKDI